MKKLSYSGLKYGESDVEVKLLVIYKTIVLK